MRPASENQQALADTAAYAKELAQVDVTGEIVVAAGCGFARGRMVTPEQLERAAQKWVAATPSRTESFDDLPPHRKELVLGRLRQAFRAAGFTVLTPPP